LEDTISSGKIDAHIIQNAHILLKTDRGTHSPKWSYKRIKEACGVRTTTIWRVRCRFLTQELDDALSRQKQPERLEKKKVTGRQKAQLITLACMEAPAGYARWSIRLLRKKVVDVEIIEEVGRETIRLVL
jgi:hypothetical protein